MRTQQERLIDALEAIEKLERYSEGVPEADDLSDLVRVWTLYHLQLLGQALQGLGPDFHRAHPEIPWKDIVGMRNILVHHYFDINLALTETTLISDVPMLKQRIKDLLQELKP